MAAAVISGLPEAPSSPLQPGRALGMRAETGMAPVRSPSLPADAAAAGLKARKPARNTCRVLRIEMRFSLLAMPYGSRNTVSTRLTIQKSVSFRTSWTQLDVSGGPCFLVAPLGSPPFSVFLFSCFLFVLSFFFLLVWVL